MPRQLDGLRLAALVLASPFLAATPLASASPASPAGGPLPLKVPAFAERSAEVKQIEEWAAQLESPEWTSETALETTDEFKIVGKSSFAMFLKAGFVDCDKVEKQGTVEVRRGGQTATGLQRFRGGIGPCGPTGIGVVDYADGSRFVGRFVNRSASASIMLYRQGLGAFFYPDGSMSIGRYELGNLVLGHLRVQPQGAGWTQGQLDANWSALDAAYFDGKGARFDGLLVDGRPAGAGRWTIAERALRISGEGLLQDGRALITGPLEVVLSAPVTFRDGIKLGVGRYAMAPGQGWTPGTPLDGARLLPYADSVAVATTQPACPLAVTAPPGWKTWGPSCHAARGAERSVDVYSRDGRYRLRLRAGGAGELHELAAGGSPLAPPVRTWRAARFNPTSPPTPVGETRYFEGEALRFVGKVAALEPVGNGLCALPAEEGQGLEPCEYRAGHRIDPLFHMRRQRQIQAQQAAEAAARQQALLAQQQAAQAAQQQESGGFQWGKFAALTTGAVLGGADKLDASAQAEILGGIVKDSMEGQEGISGLEQATSSISAQAGVGAGGYGGSSGYGAAAGGAAGGKGAVAPGSYPARPNTLDGHPACSGYTVQNYQQYYGQNSNGPDAQLHALCAGAYNYYAMYLNAIRQGYAQHDSDRTYAAFSDSARVAIHFYETAR